MTQHTQPVIFSLKARQSVFQPRLTVLLISILVSLLFLFLIGVQATNASELPPVSATNDIATIFVSTIPTGTDNIDTPLTEYQAYTGTIEVATGGASFYPDDVTNSFTVNVPACVGGNKPIIEGAYVEWYMRWRALESIVDVNAGIPTFDNDLNLDMNGAGVNPFIVTDSHWARFDATNNRVFYRRNAIIDVTDQFDTDWVAGANMIEVTGVTVPSPDETDPSVTNSEIYGVGIHVFYECPEFEYVRVGFETGLDWFYDAQDEAYAGNYSDLVCFSFPAAQNITQIDIDSIMSGQANSAAPFRGGRLFYQTGSGPQPTVNSADATGPAGPVVIGGTQIGTGYESIWVSNLGTEWDQYIGDNVVTVDAGDEWVCLQGESARGNDSDAGLSGDLLGVAFSIPISQQTDWGDLPDGIYNTDSTGAVGPSHPIIPGLGIGPSVDAETDGQPNGTATGDGVDEDGIELPPAVKPGTAATFTGTITNSTGTEAYLYGFVDWNADGDFDDPGETISATIPSGSTDLVVPLTFNVPLTATTSTDLGARFRLSTDDDLGPDGPATNGEVEDYLYQLEPLEYDLALIKRLVSSGPFKVGDPVSFQIVVMNQGDLNSGMFVVEDTLPAEMTFLSALPVPNGAPAIGSSGVITWSANNLAAGNLMTFTVMAEIDALPSGPSGTLKNIAEITADDGDDDDSNPEDNSDISDTINDDDVTNDRDDDDQDDSDFEEITVNEYDLALIKRLASTGPFKIGDLVSFQIVVMNQGALNSGVFVVEDTLPTEMTFVSALPVPNGAPAVGSSGVITWSANDLAAGEFMTFTVMAEIEALPSGSTGTLKNIAEITADDGDDDDSNPEDNSDISDTINDDDVTNDKDDDDQDDSDFELITVAEYDLALIKEIVSTGPYGVGQLVTYVVTVMNQGDVDSGDYTVADTLPAELTFVSADPPPADSPAVGNSGTIEWNATNLASGDTAAFTLTVQIDALPSAGTLKNTAEITADGGQDDDSDPTDGSGNSDTINDGDVTNDKDDNDQDDSDFELITVAEYDLALIKEIVSTGPYTVGQVITYEITVMNQGGLNSGDYTVADELPAELTFVSASPAPSSSPAVGSSGTVEWNATNLAIGDTATFVLAVRIDAVPASGGPIKNIADITADSGVDDDSDTGDSSGSTDNIDDRDVTNDKDDNDEDDSDFAVIELIPSVPTAVELEFFGITRSGQAEATVRWRTASEVDNFGFKLLRANDGVLTNAQQVNFTPSSIANGSGPGADYAFVDQLLPPGTYSYWLVDIDTFGVETLHGPVTVVISRNWTLFLPIISNN